MQETPHLKQRLSSISFLWTQHRTQPNYLIGCHIPSSTFHVITNWQILACNFCMGSKHQKLSGKSNYWSIQIIITLDQFSKNDYHAPQKQLINKNENMMYKEYLIYSVYLNKFKERLLSLNLPHPLISLHTPSGDSYCTSCGSSYALLCSRPTMMGCHLLCDISSSIWGIIVMKACSNSSAQLTIVAIVVHSNLYLDNAYQKSLQCSKVRNAWWPWQWCGIGLWTKANPAAQKLFIQNVTYSEGKMCSNSSCQQAHSFH